MVEQIAVLASLRIVDQIVAAHDRSNPSLDSICKRPDIKFMECLIIDVRRSRLSDVETIVSRFGSLPEMLLFVSDVMFGTCLYSCALYATD